MLSLRLILLFILILSSKHVKSQCSDAGICNIGDFDSSPMNLSTYQIGLDYRFSFSPPEDEVFFHIIEFHSKFQIFKSTNLNIIFPMQSIQSGPEGTINGIGDIIILIDHQLFKMSEGSIIGVSLGGKLATGNENSDADLPQIYQPGLGTNDLLFGISYLYNKINFSIGYQWVERIHNSNAQTRLKRGDDLYLKIGYSHQFTKFALTGKLIAIKRLQESSVLDTSLPKEQFKTVPDSDQLQVNFDATLTYRLDHSFGIDTSIVSAFLSREVNVDGLTRGLTFKFGGRYFF